MLQDYYVIWTYLGNYSDSPMRIRARSAKDAVESLVKFYSEDFRKKATVYAFTELPAGLWKDGKIVNHTVETNF